MSAVYEAMASTQHPQRASAEVDHKLRQQWLDKLWAVLFDEHSAGLMSPGQIRRERRDRQQVRQLEMEAIFQAEADVNDIHQGKKALDELGNLIETPPVESVATHHVIESPELEQNFDLGFETASSMIRSAVKEISVRDLERSLNIRKIAILAESEIYAQEGVHRLSRQPVNAEWMQRWRISAENTFNVEAQLIWARILIAELAKPGSFSPGALAALRECSAEELEILRFSGKYAFPDFVFSATGYFKPETHNRWFELLEDLGLMQAVESAEDLKRLADGNDDLILPCGNRALRACGLSSVASLSIPIFKLTRTGRQLLPVLDSESDLAYLYELGKYLKAKGLDVAIGEWQADTTRGGGSFVSRVSF